MGIGKAGLIGFSKEQWVKKKQWAKGGPR